MSKTATPATPEATPENPPATPETPPAENPPANPPADPATPEATPENPPANAPETPPATPPANVPETTPPATTPPASDEKDAKIAQLEREIARTKAEAAVSDKAFGARDTNAVLALIDLDKAATPETLQAELTRVKTAYPGLFYGVGSANGGAQGTPPAQDPNDWFRGVLGGK